MNHRRDGDDSPWQDTRRVPDRAQSRDELLSPSTQIVADREAYLGQGLHEVGRRISDDQVELFITGDVAGSLQREFLQQAPEFIALHDLGTSASLRLLTSLAGAAGARVQRLSIRRQGHGVALAVLQFVEMPLNDGSRLRVFATDVNADGPTRAQVARVLLAYSKLGVLLVGELPPHALAGQLAPLHEALARSANWPNRELLMIPLGSSLALAAHAAQLSQGSQVQVHVTPHADKPRQAWSYIGGAWNRLNAAAGGQRTLATDLAQKPPVPLRPAAEATTQPMDLRPIGPAPTRPAPLVPAPGQTPMPRAGGTRWQSYAERCAQIKGAVAACVFDLHTVQALAHAGASPSAERLARQGATLLAQMNEAARALGVGQACVDASLSTPTHHLLLRPVPGHPGVAVHVVVSASVGNLTLARLQLERVEAPQ